MYMVIVAKDMHTYILVVFPLTGPCDKTSSIEEHL